MLHHPSLEGAKPREKLGDQKTYDYPSDVSKTSYIVPLSLRFMVTVLLCTSALAFKAGLGLHLIWLKNWIPEEAVGCTITSSPSLDRTELDTVTVKNPTVCPSNNASMSFDDDFCTPSDSPSIIARKSSAHVQTDGFVHNENRAESGRKSGDDNTPSGYHLLVDIKDVDGAFLNSESRLIQGLLNLTERSGLALLSHHCHKLAVSGVSCFGALTKGHISLYTWPASGVIFLDFFSCAEEHESLFPLISDVGELFAILPGQTFGSMAVERPRMNWAQKPRGYERAEDGLYNLEADLDNFVLGWMGHGLKEKIVSRETDFQVVDIWQIDNPRFRLLDSDKPSLATNGESYESQNPELFQPDFLIYLDNVMQSRLYGEAAYHEALVHPGMFAHERPRNVAIIGGGEGATLREILKHNTVERVTMIDIDEEFVELCREFIPQWSDCSNLAGSATSCFDDPRAEILYEDAVAWFVDRYGEDSKDGKTADRLYDVIFIDALDPNSIVDFSDMIYNSDKLTKSLFNALSEKGILVVQTGEQYNLIDPPEEFTANKQELQFINHLKATGFQSIMNYEEDHGGLLGVWKFLVAFKDEKTKTLWYANQAQVDHSIQKRSMKTVAATPLFRYFDGATMAGYQSVSKLLEHNACFQTERPHMCDKGLFDPEISSVPISAFSVQSSNASSDGLGLFSKHGVVKGIYVAPEERVNRLFLSPFTTAVIAYMAQLIVGPWNVIKSFLQLHGSATGLHGPVAHVVDTSILIFLNHGCVGTYDMGQNLSMTEQTADMDGMAAATAVLAGFGIISAQRDLAFDRNYMLFLSAAADSFLHDVEKETEVLHNRLGTCIL